MKHDRPVIRLGEGRYRIDVLAVRSAIENGTLKPEDEAVVNQLLPGICSKIREGLKRRSANAPTPEPSSTPEKSGAKEKRDRGSD